MICPTCKIRGCNINYCMFCSNPTYDCKINSTSKKHMCNSCLKSNQKVVFNIS